ncbi:unnamed protein product [Oppiella nova]|uniref:DNA endonuclease activator Ctp1 C-terminal domain-containing protein n=1 Tax=Oppiella nova TaxID=334625 RepID=A0A7R9QSJ5_9ACAR|nr:unnamed protein product [Oppiella nova]CAG2172828.1 unnamed protein product [Oppiella nova]
MSTAMSKVDTNERKASGSQKQSLATRRSTSPVKLKVKTLGPVVRGKSQRKQLNGFTCKECEDYYKTRNLSEEGLKERLKACSRHRSQHSPPKSPEHFWETHFPTTPECIRRGIFNVENVSPKGAKSGKSSDKKCAKRLSDDFCEVIAVVNKVESKTSATRDQ